MYSLQSATRSSGVATNALHFYSMFLDVSDWSLFSCSLNICILKTHSNKRHFCLNKNSNLLFGFKRILLWKMCKSHNSPLSIISDFKLLKNFTLSMEPLDKHINVLLGASVMDQSSFNSNDLILLFFGCCLQELQAERKELLLKSRGVFRRSVVFYCIS